jgi:hypothetical protein
MPASRRMKKRRREDIKVGFALLFIFFIFRGEC